MTENETETDRCPKCGEEQGELIDATQSDDFNHDEICMWCIVKHGQRVAREGEREHRPIDERNAVNRHRRYPSSDDVASARADAEAARAEEGRW